MRSCDDRAKGHGLPPQGEDRLQRPLATFSFSKETSGSSDILASGVASNRVRFQAIDLFRRTTELSAHYRPAALAPRQTEESSIIDKVMAIHEGCAYARPEMVKVGSRIEESGMLVRARGRLVFRRDQGGRWDLEGWPKSELALGHLGRLTGYVIDDTTVAIERFIFED